MLEPGGIEVAPSNDEPFWGYVDVALFFGLTVAAAFALVFATSMLVRIYPALRPQVSELALPLQLLLYAVIFAALWVIVSGKYHQPFWRSLGWRESKTPAALAVVAGGALSIAVGVLGSLLHTKQTQSPFEQFFSSPLNIAMFSAFAIAIGPLFEELVFRGFLQPLLTRDLGSVIGIAITAGTFGLLHSSEYGGVWQFVVLISFAGACFGVMRVKAKSLAPCVYMHAGFNALFVVAAIAQKHIQK